MAKSITIGNVPDDTQEELAARAARSGRSLQEYVRFALIDLSHRTAPEDWVDRVRTRASALDREFTPDEILELRDAGRR